MAGKVGSSRQWSEGEVGEIADFHCLNFQILNPLRSISPVDRRMTKLCSLRLLICPPLESMAGQRHYLVATIALPNLNELAVTVTFPLDTSILA